MSSLKEFGVYPPASDGSNLLSGVPEKLDMTMPQNQARARSAWSQYRGRLGQPVGVPEGLGLDDEGEKLFQAGANHGRLADALHQKYLGWPDEEIFNQQMRDEGVPGGFAQLHYGKPPHEIQASLDSVDAGAGTFVDKARARSWQPGQAPVADIYVPPARARTDLGQIAHEGVHAWAAYSHPGFRPAHFDNQADPAGLNGLGEEPAPHFPGGFHDRGMVDAAEAGNLATRFGGYPRSVKPAPVWPHAPEAYPRFGGAPAPKPKYYPLQQPDQPFDWTPNK